MDIDVTKSNSQLSANWTASGGCDSGISMLVCGRLQRRAELMLYLKAKWFEKECYNRRFVFNQRAEILFLCKNDRGVGLETVSFQTVLQ